GTGLAVDARQGDRWGPAARQGPLRASRRGGDAAHPQGSRRNALPGRPLPRSTRPLRAPVDRPALRRVPDCSCLRPVGNDCPHARRDRASLEHRRSEFMSTAPALKLENHAEERLHAKRFEGVVRPYAKADVERLRGSVQIEYTLARMGARRLWELLHSDPY